MITNTLLLPTNPDYSVEDYHAEPFPDFGNILVIVPITTDHVFNGLMQAMRVMNRREQSVDQWGRTL